MSDIPPLRGRLRDALSAAMRAQDRAAMGALRATLAVLDNAEAVDRPPSVDARLALGEIPVGVGAAEVARRELTEAQIVRLVRAEVAEREAVAREYEHAGRPDHAARLRAEAAVLAAHLT